jgi:hypothetical protein
LKSKIRDLLGGGMNLLVVISTEFLVQDPLGLLDVGDVLPDASPDESVLEPAIGSFNLASGLGRKRMDDLYIAVLQNLFPLRGGFIGQKIVFSPDGVSSLDKSKDRVGINIIGVRKSISKDDGLESQNMSPAGFLLDQNGIKEEPAIIIQGSDEIPFLLGCGCPEMMRGVMLNEFSDITG